jgi:YD repeat-containing protein
MPSRTRLGLFVSLAVIGLFFGAAGSYGQHTNYKYDELNRLKRVEHIDGTITEYNYDAAGNRTSILHPVPPVRTGIIDSGASFANGTTVTLTLYRSDPDACKYVSFSNDNINNSDAVLFAPTMVWTLSPGTGLKTVYIQCQDSEGYWSNAFTDTITVCSAPAVKVGETSYDTLQDAYTAAAAGPGNTIKCLGKRFVNQSITVGGPYPVTLEGGYDCSFQTNTGGMTFTKGSITTTTGGGTITIENFILSQ